MTDKKETKAASIKVFTKRGIWIGPNDKPKKIPAGEVVELTAEQVKHYGKAVTRDLPEDSE